MNIGSACRFLTFPIARQEECGIAGIEDFIRRIKAI
jgi:hypothetical protein